MKITNEIFDMALAIQSQVVEDSFDQKSFADYLKSLKINLNRSKIELLKVELSYWKTESKNIVGINCMPVMGSELVYHGYVRGDQIVCAKALREAQDLLESKERIEQINSNQVKK